MFLENKLIYLMKFYIVVNYFMFKYICFWVDWIKIYGFDESLCLLCLDKISVEYEWYFCINN